MHIKVIIELVEGLIARDTLLMQWTDCFLFMLTKWLFNSQNLTVSDLILLISNGWV